MIARWLKAMLGVACLLASGAPAFWLGRQLLRCFTEGGPPRFMPLVVAAGLAAAALGAAVDLLSGPRRQKAPQRLESQVHGNARPASQAEARAAASGAAGRHAVHDIDFKE